MKSLKYITLFFLSCSAMFAQTGSIYSRFGMGDMQSSFSARYRGLNESGSALLDRGYLSPRNPASWSSLTMTRIEIGANYSGNSISTDDKSAFYSSLDFSGFMLGFPIEREYGITLAAGLLPYSHVNYETQVNAPANADPDDPKSYDATFKGEGGITKGFVGLSYAAPSVASLGLSLNYFVGNISYTSAIDFLGSSYSPLNYKTKYIFNGFSGTFGIISTDFSRMLEIKGISDMRLSLVYDFGGNFDGDTSLVADAYYSDETIAEGDVKVKIPGQLTIGASAKINKQYMVLADYFYQPWKDFKFAGKEYSSLRNMNRFSLAVEYKNPDERERSFWKSIALRLGFAYEQTQYMINGKGIDMISGTAGFSVPIDWDNTLDVAFLVGKRGSKENKLMQEYVYGMNFSISLGEPWFLRSRQQ